MLTLDEAARVLKKSPESVRRLAAEGKIPAVKVGRGWRFPDDLEDRIMGAPQVHRIEPDYSVIR